MKTSAVLLKYTRLLYGLLPEGRGRLSFQILDEKNGNKWVEIGTPIERDKPEFTHGWRIGSYLIKWGDISVAQWELYQMPHCCGICVSTKAEVNPTYRSRGIGTLLNNLRQDIARMLGYSLLLCTDIDKNTHQTQLLDTNGWRKVHTFVNRRTNNSVSIHVIGL